MRNEGLKIKKNINNRRSAKIEFISQKSEIEHALEAGCSMKAIWQTLQKEGKFTYGYKAFRNYVIELIKSVENNTRAGEPEKEKPKEKGFFFNPIPNPEELF